jgi:hypothetical protein
MLVGLVAWVGHIETRGDGLTPASDVVRRSPATSPRPPAETDETPGRRSVPPVPVLQRTGPSSGLPARVYLCVIDGSRHGVC